MARPAFRIFCAVLKHNWRLGTGSHTGELTCARCGLQKKPKSVPNWAAQPKGKKLF